ncbi:hypothetical protein PO909_033630, partial [Leuciscus waleckii]
ECQKLPGSWPSSHPHSPCLAASIQKLRAHLGEIMIKQEGDFLVRTHHVEYCDGGILDPDDVLTDLVEDKDKVRLRETVGY